MTTPVRPADRARWLMPRNLVLAALPVEDRRRLLPELTTVSMSRDHVLHKHGETPRYIYFPNAGLYSIVTTMGNGTCVEVATVGSEGLTTVPLLWDGWGVSSPAVVSRVQDATAERMPVDVFLREIQRGGALHDVVERYWRLLLATAMQLAACNALHSLQQRFSRWLLLAHDRVGGQPLHLSHETLGMTLGATRPTVSLAAASLQRARAISYTHGRMMVVDRAAVERRSCECYAALRAEYDRQRAWLARQKPSRAAGGAGGPARVARPHLAAAGRS
jgi:CRP-like cAMP-binding protein